MKGKRNSSSMSTAVPLSSKSALKSLHICPSCYKTFTNISKLERHYIKSHTPLGNMNSGKQNNNNVINTPRIPVNSFYPPMPSATTPYIPQIPCNSHRQGLSTNLLPVKSAAPVMPNTYESSLMPLSDMTLCRGQSHLGELPNFLPQRNFAHPGQHHSNNYSSGNKTEMIQAEDSSNTSSSSSNSQKAFRSETPKSCNVCGKEIRSRRNMKRHMLIHEDAKPYPCTNCEKSFRQASNLKTHVTVVHDDNGNLMCQLCSKVFRHSKNFKRHMLIHEGVKPYSCDRCGKEFRQAVHLKTHMITHDGHKPYSCDTCGKSFGRVANLRRHMLIHNGTKPFECQVCQKHFTQAGHLKNHILKCRDRRLFSSFQV